MGFQVESVAVGERDVCLGCRLITLCSSTHQKKKKKKKKKEKGIRKNSSWEEEEEGINALCQLIGQWVTETLSGGIDSRKEIDL